MSLIYLLFLLTIFGYVMANQQGVSNNCTEKIKHCEDTLKCGDLGVGDIQIKCINLKKCLNETDFYCLESNCTLHDSYCKICVGPNHNNINPYVFWGAIIIVSLLVLLLLIGFSIYCIKSCKNRKRSSYTHIPSSP